MSDPFTLAGTVAMQAYASYMEGAQADIRGITIRAQDEMLAQQYIKEGADETNYLERVSQARLGRNIASAAGSNVDATQGSPLLVMADQLRQDKQNEAITLSNAAHRAMAARAAGEAAAQTGAAQQQAGGISAVGSILGGYGRYAALTGKGGSAPQDPFDLGADPFVD